MRGVAVRYTKAELAFIASRAALPRRELHAAFTKAFKRRDVTQDHIRSLCVRMGWTTGRRPWSPAEDALLRELYRDMPTEKVAKRVGRTLPSTFQRARTLDLLKSAAYLASPAACRTNGRQGMGTRFVKGQVPANKGLRRPGWAPGRMKETQFKKGGRTGMYKPIGTERISREGYLKRKINDGMPLQARWRAVHLLRWEAIHGHKPKGMILKNLDGNRLNTDPSNYELIPMAMLPRLNGGRSGRLSYDAAPAELKPTIMAIAKLQHAAGKRRRA